MDYIPGCAICPLADAVDATPNPLTTAKVPASKLRTEKRRLLPAVELKGSESALLSRIFLRGRSHTAHAG
jgi:hypothetical protein